MGAASRNMLRIPLCSLAEGRPSVDFCSRFEIHKKNKIKRMVKVKMIINITKKYNKKDGQDRIDD